MCHEFVFTAAVKGTHTFKTVNTTKIKTIIQTLKFEEAQVTLMKHTVTFCVV